MSKKNISVHRLSTTVDRRVSSGSLVDDLLETMRLQRLILANSATLI